MHTLTPPKDNLFSAHVGRVEPPIFRPGVYAHPRTTGISGRRATSTQLKKKDPTYG